MKKGDLISVRDFKKDEDLNFVMATWLRSLWYSKQRDREVGKTFFMKAKQSELLKLLDDCRILVATLKDDSDVILGYAVFRKQKPVWAYVKKSWREIGICKQLLTIGKELVND